jgi:hypothetical protein
MRETHPALHSAVPKAQSHRILSAVPNGAIYAVNLERPKGRTYRIDSAVPNGAICAGNLARPKDGRCIVLAFGLVDNER